MGTPHRGTGDFTSEELMLRLINAKVPMEVSTKAILEKRNPILEGLVEEFTGLIKMKKFRDRLQVFCFFEQIHTKASEVLKNVEDKEGRENLQRSDVYVSPSTHNPTVNR